MSAHGKKTTSRISPCNYVTKTKLSEPEPALTPRMAPAPGRATTTAGKGTKKPPREDEMRIYFAVAIQKCFAIGNGGAGRARHVSLVEDECGSVGP